MKTNVRPVSIDAYRKHIESGKALTQWMRVYEFIKANPNVTRAQIEKALHMRISSVCGRVKQLLDANLIKQTNPFRCPVTGENAHGLKVVSAEKRVQVDMFGVAA